MIFITGYPSVGLLLHTLAEVAFDVGIVLETLPPEYGEYSEKGRHTAVAGSHRKAPGPS